MSAPKRKTPLEHVESAAFAKWLTDEKIFFCHVPNEGKRSGRTGARLKAEGLQKGAPDFLIFDFGGVAIEMKRQSGAYRGPTKEQKAFLRGLELRSWQVHVAKGADHAIEITKAAREWWAAL